ncbi:MAG: protoporphyrinogen oxidase, partial [Rhodobacteraceae bacterium]|nr:protoporphyrinogen oxidase [Paracoccaceae bacterium]
ISGLATAAALAECGCDVTVLERQVGVGGNAISERFDGFLMEHGPSTLNAAFPNVMDNISRLGIGGSTVDMGPGVQKRYLRDQGRLYGISTHRLGFLLSPYLSPLARLRFLTEVFRPRRTDAGEETVHAFVSRRFGREFADKVMEPLSAGIFMGDARQLSVSGAFPKLVEMERRFGSILRAVIAASRGSEPGRQLFSWPGGIATLPQAL